MTGVLTFFGLRSIIGDEIFFRRNWKAGSEVLGKNRVGIEVPKNQEYIIIILIASRRKLFLIVR